MDIQIICFESLISTELPSCETNQVKDLREIYGNVSELNLLSKQKLVNMFTL